MSEKASLLIRNFQEGNYEQKLLDLYADPELIARQTGRYIALLEKFLDLFGDEEVEIYSAPGRSEVGGNHTDHQHGQVLAASINLDTIAVAAKTEDNTITVKSDDYPLITVSLSSLEAVPAEEGTSAGLIRGVAAFLHREGYTAGGFRAVMTSEVLGGSGLSSSAAFEVLVGNILSGFYNEMKIDPVTIAVASQFAENRYFGKPCGLMDQMASSVGALINIDFKTPEKPEIHQVTADFGKFGHSLCIVDTKGSHADLTDDYAAIPAEMKKIAAHFGAKVLRDVPEEQVLADVAALRQAYGDRPVLRAIHFYEDHKRVSREVEALEKGDFGLFCRLIRESGDSSFKYLQNVYTVKDTMHQNLSLALALSELVLGSEGACRVHGGGFAGTIQAFVPEHLVDKYRDAMDRCFGEGSCHVLKVRKYGGVRVIA